jgi:hypothetical protein
MEEFWSEHFMYKFVNKIHGTKISGNVSILKKFKFNQNAPGAEVMI